MEFEINTTFYLDEIDKKEILETLMIPNLLTNFL